MIQLKSRRLNYYDYDKQKTRSRLFSSIEIEQANNVFDTVEDILLENDLIMGDKWVSEGKNDTYFMIEVISEILDIDTIHEIEEAIEKYHVRLSDIIARHYKRDDYLQLVIIQQHPHV